MAGDISRLGIAVVYLVGERNGPLLDLHLDQIDRCTDVPYTIYAAANRLLPQFRPRLEGHKHVRICPCETFDISAWTTPGEAATHSKHEHSFYLEQLVRLAIDDGVSHVAILHVDSFPIRVGWARLLAARLSSSCVLAAILRDEITDRKPLTACMLFHREFYLRYTPHLLASEEEVSSTSYRQYAAAWPHARDSGSGYGFRIFAEGLSWYAIRRSASATRDEAFAGVYDDLVFHLAEAAFVEATGTMGFFRRTLAWRLAFRLLPRPVYLAAARRRDAPRRERWEQHRQRLLEDPQAFLAALLTHPGHPGP